MYEVENDKNRKQGFVQRDSCVSPAEFASISLLPQSFDHVGKAASRGND